MARRRPSVAPAAALPAAALGGAVLAGSLLAFQARANGSLAARLGSPVVAALVTYGVASATLLAVVVAAGQLPSLRLARSAGWYWWLGGLAGAAVVVTTAASVPLLGVALVSVCLVAGATSGGLVADWAGLGPDGPRRPSARRLAGAVLAVGGVGVGLLGQRGQHGHPLLVLLVLAVGFCSAGQQAASGHLAAATGDARAAALVASVVAAAALAATVALLAALGRLPQVRWSAPAWTYLGGLAVAAYGTVAAAVVRRLGVLLLTLATVSGQLLGSVVLDTLAPAPGGLRAATVAAALVTLAAVAVAAGRPARASPPGRSGR
jgi:transporter family-2 protein